MCGYCLDIQVIHLDIQVNSVINFREEIRMVLPFPSYTPQCITFLIFISQKILLNIKDVESDFRIGGILV